MRWLIIVLFLVSFGSISMAEEGDVYYCEVHHNHNYTLTMMIDAGKYIFKFKLTENELIFKNPTLKNTKHKLFTDLTVPIVQQKGGAVKAERGKYLEI